MRPVTENTNSDTTAAKILLYDVAVIPVYRCELVHDSSCRHHQLHRILLAGGPSGSIVLQRHSTDASVGDVDRRVRKHQKALALVKEIKVDSLLLSHAILAFHARISRVSAIPFSDTDGAVRYRAVDLLIKTGLRVLCANEALLRREIME